MCRVCTLLNTFWRNLALNLRLLPTVFLDKKLFYVSLFYVKRFEWIEIEKSGCGKQCQESKTFLYECFKGKSAKTIEKSK